MTSNGFSNPSTDKFLVEVCADGFSELHHDLQRWALSGSFKRADLEPGLVFARLIRCMVGASNLPLDLDRIQSVVSRFRTYEDLMVDVLCGLGQKFYRDHLDHMLRVFLLCQLLARDWKIASSRPAPANPSWIGSLLHDIGYPVQAVNLIASTLEEAYAGDYGNEWSSVRVQLPAIVEQADRMLREIGMTSIEPLRLVRQMERRHHAVVGASTIAYCCRGDIAGSKPARDIALIILQHDSQTGARELDMRVEPESVITLIADELQDWGRPVGGSEIPPIKNLTELEVTAHRVHCKLDFSAVHGAPVFNIVLSKLNNLSRILLVEDAEVMLGVILPAYDRLRMWDEVENVLKGMRNAKAGIWKEFAEATERLLKSHSESALRTTGLFRSRLSREVVVCTNCDMPVELWIHGWHGDGPNWAVQRRDHVLLDIIPLKDSKMLRLLKSAIAVERELIEKIAEAAEIAIRSGLSIYPNHHSKKFEAFKDEFDVESAYVCSYPSPPR